MISFLCNRCLQLTISVEGLHCFYCDQEKIRNNEMSVNFYLPVPEPGTEGSGYYDTTVDVNTRKFVRDLMLPEPSMELSIQTADDDLNVLKETSGLRGEENCIKKDCSTQRKISQDLEGDSIIKKKRLSGSLPTNQEDFHQKSGTRNSQSEGTLLQFKNYTSLALRQRKNLRDQSAIEEFENNHDSVGMLKRQEILEPTEHVKKAGKHEFPGSILFQPENSPLSLSSESSKNAIEQASDYIHGFFSSLDQKSSISKYFKGNLFVTKTSAEEAAKYCVKRFRRNCWKCGGRFYKEWAFYAHIRSNCDPKPVVCNQCDFVTMNRNTYNSHMKLHDEYQLFTKNFFSKQ